MKIILDSPDVDLHERVEVKYINQNNKMWDFGPATVVAIKVIPRHFVTHEHLIGFTDPNPSSLRMKLKGDRFYFVTLHSEAVEEDDDDYDDAPSYERYGRRKKFSQYDD